MANHFSIFAGKSYGQRSLAGNSPWGCKELDTTEHAADGDCSHEIKRDSLEGKL